MYFNLALMLPVVCPYNFSLHANIYGIFAVPVVAIYPIHPLKKIHFFWFVEPDYGRIPNDFIAQQMI